MPVETERVARAPSGRFGVYAAGVALLLPQVALEHVVAATVHPLPGAGECVLGLAQLRGHPVVVLDPRGAAAGCCRPGYRPSLLVIGTPPEAGALVVESAPLPVRLGAADADAPRPEVPFAGALDGAVGDADDQAMLWWRFDPSRLFELLAAR